MNRLLRACPSCGDERLRGQVQPHKHTSSLGSKESHTSEAIVDRQEEGTKVLRKSVDRKGERVCNCQTIIKPRGQ